MFSTNYQETKEKGMERTKHEQRYRFWQSVILNWNLLQYQQELQTERLHAKIMSWYPVKNTTINFL